ncbi:MarR family transcriptional regulator [Stieleria sp. ICT_E10.1]|uniref:MarR family winged helix-turn-helix transcriptional regulator n=1 Tax=Stieleria sedimenti TaxID=2976331 RepID=UPI00217F5B39|nr:MarR family transcriptional regulator [Stieleria sedimenti]MCS7467913.1 MarR family transcriptional regulator [Stieleria sedimenti]
MKKKANESPTLADEIGKRDPFSSLQQETYLNLLRTSTQLQREFVLLFESAGLSDSQYNVLRILQGAGTPMQIYQIGQHLITPQADISRLIDRIAKANLVKRERCGEDRRVVWIRLAPKGRAALKKLAKPLEDLHRSQFNELSKQELAILNELLFRARHTDN